MADRVQGGAAAPRPLAFAAGNSARWVPAQRWKLYNCGRLHDMSAGREEVAPLTISGASEAALRGLRLVD